MFNGDGFYVCKSSNKLFRVTDTSGVEHFKFTEGEFERLCNLLGCNKEDYHRVEMVGIK